MGWPVVLTEQSQRDLKEIVTYISADDPEAARRLGHRLIEVSLSLGNFPEMGREVPELKDPDVREITHRSYRIVYEISRERNSIYVLRFWHAARGKPRRSDE